MLERRCVIYVRVSTEEQKHRGYSLPEQVRACRLKAEELAAALGARLSEAVERVDHIFEDTAPGDILERPALSAMRAWVRTHRPDWVVCLDPDRLARRLILQCLVADELERSGTQLVFVQHDFDRSSPEGRAFFQMRGILAELEKAKIIERTSRGKRGKLAQGGVPHNVQPYGWDYERATGRYRANPTEVLWVRRIFNWVAADGLTPGQVAMRLTALGVPPPSARRRKRGVGRCWHASTVRAMLQNRAYVGELTLNRADWQGIQGRRQLPVALRRALPPDEGGGPLRARPRSPEEWVRLPIVPLVETHVFAAVQERLQTSRRSGRKPRLMSGLLCCGTCGGSVHYEAKRGLLYLVCSNRYRGTRTCGQKLLRAEPIEALVWAKVEAALGEAPAVAGNSRTEEAVDLDRLQTQKQEARQTVLRLLRDGAIDEAEARQELERLQGQLQALAARQQACEEPPPARLGPGEVCSVEERRLVVQRVVERITVSASGAQVSLKGGPWH